MATADRPERVERVDRSQIRTKPLAMPPEVRDTVLRFAVDTLKAEGANVRIEAEDLVSATLRDGTNVRYTTTLARAREDEQTQLLVPGSAALADLVERCGTAATLGALALPERVDPIGAARAGVSAARPGCAGCTRATAARGSQPACDGCPVRTGQIVLAGLGRLGDGRVARSWDAWSVELAYEVAYSDRHGRRTEWLRLAFDLPSGEPRAVLDPVAIRSAGPAVVPVELTASISTVQAQAERTLAQELAAGAAYLRLRSEGDFRARLADLESRARRLLRETADDAAQISASMATETERLQEVFAIEVEARLHSVCFVQTPVREVAFALSSASRSSLTLSVDLGRGVVIPPPCSACGIAVRAGSVCARGHVTCPSCAGRAEADEACAACAQGGSAGASGTKPARSKRQAASGATSAPLSLTHVRQMSHDTWREFAGWLVEQDGIRLERVDESGEIVVWRGRRVADDAQVCAAALRPIAALGQTGLSGDDVRRAVAAMGPTDGCQLRLIATARAGDDAASEARRLGVDLMDGEALARRLDALVASQTHAHETERVAADAVAHSAARARDALLADVAALEEVLAHAGNGRRASGGTAVATAVATVDAARQEALRAFLAWDTLAGEWIACFDERAARDGVLVILADDARFADLTQRAAHLRAATAAVLARIAPTPGGGELGYGAWRRAVVEELTARCESCRWRLLAVDPARWEDFAAAHDGAALERATAADAAAGHAAGRVAKAYADMAARARL